MYGYMNGLFKIVGVARRKERLDALAKKSASRKGSFHPIQADVSKEEDVLRVFKWTKDNLGPVSILINNAGTVINGYLSESKTEDWNTILQLNVVGLSMATREALKVMKENKIKGHIIHINSIAGHYVKNLEGGFAMYIASKHAVTALTESLRMELSASGHKIKVTSVSPGLVDTEIITEDFKKTETYKKAIEEESILLPEDIADGVMYALSTPPRVQSLKTNQLPSFYYSCKNFVYRIVSKKKKFSQIMLPDISIVQVQLNCDTKLKLAMETRAEFDVKN
ncbi:unnamed protein product [Phaedon cochleariae]|uniref:Dehydrogenase/reductase SDR family member 11 n=1 Tax=Phaedon cochleariae TaxID=80249 RepID=A0A9N9SA96_PHACE|nr:unnamed protein product [Phaedon cochleariae]